MDRFYTIFPIIAMVAVVISMTIARNRKRGSMLGVRSKASMESDKAWRDANTYCAKATAVFTIINAGLILTYRHFNILSKGLVIITLSIMVITPLILTNIHMKKINPKKS